MKRVLRRGLIGVGVGVVALATVLAVNTVRFAPPDVAQPEPFDLGADLDRAVQTLSQAVQYRTVSTDLSAPDFPGFVDFLTRAYPSVHGAMQREILTANTVLLKWPGQTPDLAPVLIAAHYDVVPVAPGSEDRWTYPAFEGAVADGYVWGRGTLDDKGGLVAILSAAEHLIDQGFTPQRDIYFSFGGDEEVGGRGAFAVAKHLIDNDIRLAWALDEGSFVLDGIIPGLPKPVASINTSEKGYLTLNLIARAPGGHSALPPQITAAGRVARAVDRLQMAPLPGGLDGLSAEFFDALARHFSLERRVLFANDWLFGPVIENVLSGANTTNAMLRTTTAPTMLRGSSKENVLPTEAVATVNFRLHPRDTVEGVIAHVVAAIDDPEVEVVMAGDHASEASPVASSSAQGYVDIESSILAVFGDVIPVPGMTIAATDARHYALAAEGAYRISPFQLTDDDLARFHGTDERLSIDNLGKGIDFYGRLIGLQ